MSVTYAVEAKIKDRFSYSIIEKLVNYAHEIGIHFRFDPRPEKIEFPSSEFFPYFFDKQQTINYIMSTYENFKEDHSLVELVIKYEDAWIGLNIQIHNNNEFSLVMYPWSNDWVTNIDPNELYYFKNKKMYSLDLNRYSKLLLRLIEIFECDDFKISQDYFNVFNGLRNNTIAGKFTYETEDIILINALSKNLINNEFILIDGDKFKNIDFYTACHNSYTIPLNVAYQNEFFEIRLDYQELYLRVLSELKEKMIDQQKVIDSQHYIDVFLKLSENLVLCGLNTNLKVE